MIGFIIGLIGFLVTTGTFGLQIVEAASLMEYWYWFTSIVISIIALILIVIFVLGAAGVSQHAKLSKGGSFLAIAGGGLLGTILAVIIVSVQWACLWITIWLQENVNQNATDWASLSQDARYAVIGLVILIIISILNGIRMKGK